MTRYKLAELKTIIAEAVKAAVAKSSAYVAKTEAKKTTAPLSLEEVNVALQARALQPIKPERAPTRSEVRAETGPGVQNEVDNFVGAMKAQRKLVRPKT